MRYKTTSTFGSQSVVSSRNEIEIAAISQKLQLLANFRFYVLVSGIEPAKLLLECIDVVNLKFTLANSIDALHHLY